MLLRPSGNQPPLPASPLLLSKVTYLNTCSEHAVTKLPRCAADGKAITKTAALSAAR